MAEGQVSSLPLLSADTVVVSPALAGEVREIMSVEVQRRRMAGVPVSAGVLGVLSALEVVSGRRRVGVSSSPSVVWISAGEAAALIGLTVRTVNRLAGKGKLRARRVGRSWVIDADDALAEADARRFGTAQDIRDSPGHRDRGVVVG